MNWSLPIWGRLVQRQRAVTALLARVLASLLVLTISGLMIAASPPGEIEVPGESAEVAQSSERILSRVSDLPDARPPPFDLSRLISERAPWMIDLLLWIAGAFLVGAFWLLVAIPAWLALPIARRTRQAVADTEAALRVRSGRQIRGLREALVGSLEPFLSAQKLRELQDKPQATWLASLRSIGDPILGYQRSADAAAGGFGKVSAQVHDASNALRDFTLPAFQVPEFPMPTVIHEEVRRYRGAWVNLTLSTTFVVALLVVNTGMLSQILRELGIAYIIPGTAIRLNYIFAFILTLIEASTGMIHAHYSHQEGQRPAQLIPQLAALVFALLLCLMEGLFYSRVGDAGQQLLIPFIDQTLNFEQTFFFLGFALPGVLFLLGHIVYTSLREVVDATSAHAAGRYIARLRQSATATERKISDVSRALDDAKQCSAEASRLLPQVSAELTEKLLHEVSRLRERVDSLAETAPAWVSARVEALDRAELLHEATRAGALLTLMVVLLAFSAWVHATALSDTYPELGTLSHWIVAALRVACLLVAGSLLRSRPLVHEDGAVLRPAARMGHALRLALALGVAVPLVAFDLWMIAHSADRSIVSLVLWSLSMASDLAIIAIGRELTPVASIAVTGAVATGLLVAIGLGVAAWVTIALLLIVLLMVEIVLGIFASPITWWTTRAIRRAGATAPA